MKIGVFEARKLIGDISFSYFSLEVCENVIFNVFPSPPLPVVLHLDWSKCGDFRSGRTLTEPSVCTCGTKDRPSRHRFVYRGRFGRSEETRAVDILNETS